MIKQLLMTDELKADAEPIKPPVKKSGQDPADDISKLKQEIETLTNQLKRSQADFVNYKNRTERDQVQFVLLTYADVFLRILPVLDHLKLAVTHVPLQLKDDEWTKGVLQTVKQFEDTVQQLGLERIASIGEKVNPELHEVVTQGEGEPDVILEELEPGYLFRGKTVRPAKVKVGG